MLPLVLLAVWIGLYPTPLLRRMEPSIKFVLDKVSPAIVRMEQRKGYKPLGAVVEQKEWKSETPAVPGRKGE